MQKHRWRTAFRILYSSSYTLLFIVLLALLLITPADAIRQALDNQQLYNVFVIASTYFVTVVFAILIYATRLFTNRSVLAGIPAAWIPVEKGDVSKSVRKMIVDGLNRNAIIAWETRPRVCNDSSGLSAKTIANKLLAAEDQPKKRHTLRRKRSASPVKEEKEEQEIPAPPSHSIWSDISHTGWASPLSPDLANIQYITVILELPHLIEAKAVSLAPPDPNFTTTPPAPDFRAIDLLQRPATMGLRDYMYHLISIGVLPPTSPTEEFLAPYEYARFSTETLSESEFRNLMKLFAHILREMTSISPAVLASFDSTAPSIVETDIDDDASSKSTPVTPRSRSLRATPSIRSLRSSHSGSSQGTIRTAPLRRHATNGTTTTRRNSQLSTTALATPRSRRPRRSSHHRLPYRLSPSSSSSSLRSMDSVIKNTNAGAEL